MRVEEQPAYILHQRPFRDTSQILEVFTRDYGRLSLMSRGSRGAKSKVKSSLQPFRALVLSWSGRGEMPTLTRIEPASQSVVMMQGKSLACALYINELMMNLTYRHAVNESLFSQYHQTINRLFEPTTLEQELRLFELKLLEQMGITLDLYHEADSEKKLLPELDYYFVIEKGFFPSMASKPEFSSPVVSGKSLIDFSRCELSEKSTLRDVKKIMRYILHYYLGGKALKSRELFRSSL